MTIKKAIKITTLSVIVAAIISAPSFAAVKNCIDKDSNLSTEKSNETPVKCVTINENGENITIYGKSSKDCASAGAIASNPDGCGSSESVIEEPVYATKDYVDEELAKSTAKIEELEKQVKELQDKNKAVEEDSKNGKTMPIVAIAAAAIAFIVAIIATIKKSKASTSTPAAPVAPTTPIAPENNQNPFITQ